MASLVAAQHFSSFSSQAVNSCHVLLSHAVEIIYIYVFRHFFNSRTISLYLSLCHSFYLFSSLRNSGGRWQIVSLSLLYSKDSRLSFSVILKSAGCLSPLFLCQQVVLPVVLMPAGRLLLFPKQQVSLSLLFFRQQFILFSVTLLTTRYFSLSFWWQHVVFLFYSKDRRFSISPLFFRL